MEQKYKGWSILVDCDGVLTDGKKYVNNLGNRELIAFHSRDAIACKALVKMGFQVIVLTHSSYSGIGHYWMKYGAYIHVSKGGDQMTNKLDIEKWESVKIDWEKTIGIGDDITDDCFLEKCKYPYIVADHHPFYSIQESVRYYAHTKYPALDCNGGGGVLAAIWSKINENLI